MYQAANSQKGQHGVMTAACGKYRQILKREVAQMGSSPAGANHEAYSPSLTPMSTLACLRASARSTPCKAERIASTRGQGLEILQPGGGGGLSDLKTHTHTHQNVSNGGSAPFEASARRQQGRASLQLPVQERTRCSDKHHINGPHIP
eukprot:2512040-Rhodomonas_salina.1